MIKLTRLVETAPYDKFWTYAIWEVLYKLHCDIILVLMKLTRLVETAPYDKDVNELLIKLTRLVLYKLVVGISVKFLPDT